MVITLVVYWQVENHGFLNYDDDMFVYNNPHVAEGITGPNLVWAFTSDHAAIWHPLTWISHMADVQLYGMDPRGHHLTNVFIHATTTILIFLFLVRLSGSIWRSAFVAALFALHPLHVESVAWVAERKDVLSAFFWFLTLLLYAEYVAKRKPLLYWLSLCTFALGLMSKPMLVTLPAVMLLVDFWPLNRFSPDKDKHKPGQRRLLERLSPLIPLVREKLPFIACSLLSAAATLYAQQNGGAMHSIESFPFGLRMENALIAYAAYLGKTLFPHSLAVFYPYPSAYPLWQVAGSLLVLLLVSVATIRARRQYPYLAMGWFWFLVTLVPVIGLVQVGWHSMADRYTYIPLTGLFIMAAWGVPALAKGLRYRQRVLALLAGGVIIASAATTWQQLGYWRDSVSLFSHALQVTSNNYMAHNNLGIAFGEKGDIDAEISEYREALAIAPNFAVGYFNLGTALGRKGDRDAAISMYRKTLALDQNNFEAHNNLGIALGEKGDIAAEISEYRAALAITPDSAQAHNNLGAALDKIGDLDGAIMEYRKALAIFPNLAVAQNSLELALERKRWVERYRGSNLRF